MVADNTSKFGNVTVGIHGQELPQYAQTLDSKQWWKYERMGKDDPKVQSRLRMKQNQQYWAKNDEVLLADMSHDQAPQDTFKQIFVAKAGIKPIPNKINLAQHVADESLMNIPQIKKGFQPKMTWTSEMMDFGSGPNVTTRFFDRVVANGTTYEVKKEDRERKLRDFLAMPQRGSVTHNNENIGETIASNTKIQATNNPNQKPSLKAIQVSALPAERSISHPSKSEVSIISTLYEVIVVDVTREN